MASAPEASAGSRPGAGAEAPASGAPTRTAAPRGRDGGAAPYVNLYLSKLIGLPVREEGNPKPIGRLLDIGAARLQSSYPQSVAIEVRQPGAGRRRIPWSAVRRVEADGVVISRSAAGEAPAAEFWARRDVLDRRVLDIKAVRTVRSLDVHFLYTDGLLIFGHVEEGVLGLLRRLRIEPVVQFFAQWFRDCRVRERYVTWRQVEVLSPDSRPAGVRVPPLSERLTAARHADVAAIMRTLGVRQAMVLTRLLTAGMAAGALAKAPVRFRRAMTGRETVERAAAILGAMTTRDAASTLRRERPDRVAAIAAAMEPTRAAYLRRALASDPRSAGSVMSTSCLEGRLEDTAEETLGRVRKVVASIEAFAHVYILDEQRRLIGLLSLRELLAAPASATLESLMARDPVTVRPDTSLRAVARLFAKYRFRAVPVVNEDDVFVGAVRLISVIDEVARVLRWSL